MCYFITVAVDESHERSLKAKLGRVFGVSPSNNPSIRINLQPTDVAFQVTEGMCSCDLYGPVRVVEDQEDKIRSKYKRRGWTEAKINRAISDSRLNQQSGSSGLRSDIRGQLSDLATEIGKVCLVVHRYSGSTDTERVPIDKKKTVRCEALGIDDEAVEEDTLIEIIP